VQFIGQIVALTILRRRQPGLKRPYRQWLYPIPSLIALVGWIYIFHSSGWPAIRIMIGWTMAGIVAYFAWPRSTTCGRSAPRRSTRSFGPRRPPMGPPRPSSRWPADPPHGRILNMPVTSHRRGRRTHAVAAAIAALLALVGPGAGAAPPAQAAHGTGVERTPVMGCSSWSFLRMGVNARRIEAEAHAMVTSGLRAAGHRYVNLDDNWYDCPGPQGPDVDLATAAG
jgi:hypothetical protein